MARRAAPPALPRAVPVRPGRTGSARGEARGPITLRRATIADLPVLVRHRRGMWEEIGGRTARDLDRADGVYRRWARREMAGGKFLGLLAVDPIGRAAASGVLWIAPAHPRPGRFARLTTPTIMSMYTDPAFRRLGLASRIVTWMVAWARARGYARIYLNASTMGRPVYAKLGFVSGNEMRLDLQAPRGRRSVAAGTGRRRR